MPSHPTRAAAMTYFRGLATHQCLSQLAESHPTAAHAFGSSRHPRSSSPERRNTCSCHPRPRLAPGSSVRRYSRPTHDLSSRLCSQTTRAASHLARTPHTRHCRRALRAHVATPPWRSPKAEWWCPSSCKMADTRSVPCSQQWSCAGTASHRCHLLEFVLRSVLGVSLEVILSHFHQTQLHICKQ